MAIPTLGSELAGYRIDGLIGRGGMGVVYCASDLRLGRRVAIKLIAAERAQEPGMRERFEREARLMAAIDHPNVVPVFAAGEDDGCLYLVMRYVDGTDLATLLHQAGRLDPERAVAITEKLAGALDAAHAAGLVHRDIKPANVLLDGQHVYLSDFGLGRAIEATTRLTDSNDWLGTVDFCSPEQLRCERVDARSDVYSLGCLLHAALTGTPPHHRATAAATMLAQLNESPPAASAAPGVPPALDPVLARALAKRPDDRYATAGELAQSARTALATAPTERPVTTRTRGRRRPEPDPETVAARTRRLRTAGLRTKLDLRSRRPHPDEPVAARRRGLLLPVALLLGLAGAVLGPGLAAGGGPKPPGPLAAAEANRLVQAFARDYGSRDSSALGSLFASDVVRADAGSITRGRAAVVSEYRSELADGSIVGYRLSGVQVTPGWIARVSARYAVLRVGRATATGQITFGIDRDKAQPRIALIAIPPAQ